MTAYVKLALAVLDVIVLVKSGSYAQPSLACRINTPMTTTMTTTRILKVLQYYVKGES